MSTFDVISSLSDEQVRAVHELFKNEWWTKDRSLEEVRLLVANSLSVALVESKSQKLIAYSRVITDRVRYGSICDVIVAPEYRGQKLGKRLLEAIFHHPELTRITSFELKCLPEMMPFYEKFGFTLPSTECCLMVHKRA